MKSAMPGKAGHDRGAGRPHVKLVFLGFALIGAVLLLAGPRAHVLPWLPWLLLAACPMMHHLFMHHRHGGHDHRGGAGRADGRASIPPGPDAGGSGDTSR